VRWASSLRCARVARELLSRGSGSERFRAVERAPRAWRHVRRKAAFPHAIRLLEADKLTDGAAGAGAPTGLQNQYGVVARR
jgi:hypothetical protein